MRILLALDIIRDYLISNVRKEDIMILLNRMDDVGDKKFIDKGTKEYLYLNKLIKSETSIPVPYCSDVKLDGVPPMDGKYKERMKEILNETIKGLKKNNHNQLSKKEHADAASRSFELFACFYQQHLLKSKAIDIVVSDDLFFHQLSKETGNADCVYTSEDYMERIASDYHEVEKNTNSIKKVQFKDIDVNQSFFDSFRDEYVEFNDWFGRKAENYAYITSSENGRLTSFLYLKLESANDDYGDIKPEFRKANRLKIGSFKVMLNGVKTGEAFFKIIFEEALRLKVDEIYVTVFDTYSNRRRLISRMERWGFVYYGTKDGKELVYVRDFSKKVREKYRLSYPYHTVSKTNFIIPLTAKSEEELFGDVHFNKTGVYNNPIRKMLLLRGVSIPSGSVLLFYSQNKNRWLYVGIAEECRNYFGDFQEFFVYVKRRTSFSQSQLRELWETQTSNEISAVKFLDVYHLSESDKQIIQDNMAEMEFNIDGRVKEIIAEDFRMIIKGTDYEKDIVVD